MNLDELLQQMKSLQDKKTLKATNLEEFLRALWGQINIHKETATTWALFVTLFEKAWISDPIPFDEAWLEITERTDLNEHTVGGETDDFHSLQQQILYQIADLRRMREAGYYEREGMELYMGVDSPTGARWYNFTIPDFLEAAFRGLQDSVAPEEDFNEATWFDLDMLLNLGQGYE